MDAGRPERAHARQERRGRWRPVSSAACGAIAFTASTMPPLLTPPGGSTAQTRRQASTTAYASCSSAPTPCSILTGPIYVCDAEPGDVLQVGEGGREGALYAHACPSRPCRAAHYFDTRSLPASGKPIP